MVNIVDKLIIILAMEYICPMFGYLFILPFDKIFGFLAIFVPANIFSINYIVR